MVKNQNGFSVVEFLVILVVVGIIGFAGYTVFNRTNSGKAGRQEVSSGDANSTDPIIKGKLLSNNQCSGEGSKKLTHAPMDAQDINAIVPHGLMVADHVTPVDHQYYYQKDLMAAKDTYKVYAPANGTIVGLEHHGDDADREERWRMVISYSCTFFSYYDLLTGLDKAIEAKLPTDWNSNNPGNVNIPVKSGQVIGLVGGQSLDFAVWDTTKSIEGLLYPVAYNNREPWKINTVSPLDYFSNEVKAQITPKYVGSQQPKDGKIGYDIDGKAVGTWFRRGTNGYAGSNDPNQHEGHKGHLALAYDHVDPSALTVSTGDFNGQPAQFATVNGTDFKIVDDLSGVVKYTLADRDYVDGNGRFWNGSEFASNIKMKPGGVRGVLLIQMTAKQELKIEFFPGKSADQVNGFTSNASTYDRGQDAEMLTDPGRT